VQQGAGAVACLRTLTSATPSTHYDPGTKLRTRSSRLTVQSW
jgi:hypothetical protein